MFLAVDMGNSRIKWAVFRGDDVRVSGDCDGAEALPASLPSVPLRGAAVASVVPDRVEAVRQAIGTHCGLTPRVAGRDLPIPIENLCRPPEGVGVDRLLNALAAYDRFRRACVVVDAGSAVTVDAVDAQGRFAGGAIAPGPGLMAEALARHTAQLPRVAVRRPDAPLGRDTQGAIEAGTYWGAVGLLAELIGRVAATLPAGAPVIGTGGWADLFPHVEAVNYYDEHLTLRGLRLAHETLERERR